MKKVIAIVLIIAMSGMFIFGGVIAVKNNIELDKVYVQVWGSNYERINIFVVLDLNTEYVFEKDEVVKQEEKRYVYYVSETIPFYALVNEDKISIYYGRDENGNQAVFIKIKDFENYNKIAR